MTNQKFKIKIESPCSIDKGNFTPTESGYFCAHCHKNVVDYTQYNDRQLAHVLGREETNGCGIFTKQQLAKVYSTCTKTSRWPLWLFSGLLATRLVAQETSPTNSTSSVQQTKVDSLLVDSTTTETLEAEESKATDTHKVSVHIDAAPQMIYSDVKIDTISMIVGDFVTPASTNKLDEFLAASKDTLNKVIRIPKRKHTSKTEDDSAAKGLFAIWLHALLPKKHVDEANRKTES